MKYIGKNILKHDLIVSKGNISGSATSTGSFGRIVGNGGNTTLGSGSVELNTFTTDTTMYSAINTIDSVLNKLAPSKPVNLSTLALGFSGVTTYTLFGTNGESTSSIITDTTPTIKPGGSSNTGFYDGDSGTLTAQRAVNDGAFSTIGDKELSTASDVSGTSTAHLQITDDSDPHDGTAGSEGFWKQLKATINETGRTAGTDKYTNRLIHSVTGTATDLDYYVETNGLFTDITRTNISHSRVTNGQHYQSGIPYLGEDNSISSSYTCTLHASSNFLNDDRKIGSTRFNTTNIAAEVYLTASDGTSWTAEQAFNTTSSLVINDNRFNTGTQAVEYEEYKSTSTNGTENTDVDITSQAFNIDSKTEDETKPAADTYRSGSGTGQFPSFAYGNKIASATTFGSSFNTTASLKTSDHYELQFSNEYFHWPASTNYTSYIPIGPDYSSMTSDSHESLRWVTFNIGDITNASSVDIRLENCYGFDNSDVQTSDGFEMYLKVMLLDSEVTKWIDANATYDGGDPGASSDGDAGVSSYTNPGTSGNFLRTITFGTATRTGTVYVRVGWNVGGGTDPTDDIRKLKYIYKT